MVSPYGDVFPCGVHPLPAGNLREKSFHEIWTGSPLLRDLRARTIDDLRNGAKPCRGSDAARSRSSKRRLPRPFPRGEAMAEIDAEVRNGRA